MKCISIWVSKTTNPNSFERVITFLVDSLVNEVKIHLEEVEK